jgi:hypothetical protein
VADVVFSPTFEHRDWVDNVSRIQAGGPDGFNVRLRAIDDDLHQASTVVGQIDTLIDNAGRTTPPGQQRIGVPLALQLVAGTPWECTTTGAFRAAEQNSVAQMNLVLPDGVRLASFRLAGRYVGPGTFRVSFIRTRLTAGSQDVIVEAVGPGNIDRTPYDLTLPVPSPLATVDLATFRYVIVTRVESTPMGPTTLDTVQIVYDPA